MWVDAFLDRKANTVKVVERVEGKRVYKDYPVTWSFYYNDRRGKHNTMFGNPVALFSTQDKKEFDRELKLQQGNTIWESDINPVHKLLETTYLNAAAPTLNVCLFDIEVDFCKKRGYSSPEDPFNAITAITLWCSWLGSLITLALPPTTLTMPEAEALCEEFDNTYLFTSEADMLKTFLDLIEDADVLSGWNSEGYDIPYTVRRMERVLSKSDTRRFCLWDQLPKRREYEKFGKQQFTYDLVGRIHLDSLEMYRQYTYHEMHSYSLDAIAEYELNERKVQYEGTLDDLYNKDFKKFIDYNRQDTLILKRLDDKLQFLDLANQLAHENTVPIPKTSGAVAVTEQAIINYAHKLGVVVPDKVRYGDDFDSRAAGAYVATPKQGLHNYVGAIDINSLYPSAIRSLNMSPETLLGQLRPTHTTPYREERMRKGASFADSWEGLFGTMEYTYVAEKDIGNDIFLDWKSGNTEVLTGAEIFNLVWESGKHWTLSGNGTLFDNTKKGIVPSLLETWYAERQQLQSVLKVWKGLAKGIDPNDPDQAKVHSKMLEIIPEEERELRDGKWYHLNDARVKTEIGFWDKRQLVKKINLNSLYGAILNKHCRFYVFDIGQSTTLTGRLITRHMSAYVNEALTGEYDHTGKCIAYGDTDSVYFTGYPALKDDIEAGKLNWDKDVCIEVYDAIADAVNESFPVFMRKAFNCTQENGEIIQGGRELVASSGLFISKKRYGLMIYDDEGTRVDIGKPGKVKAMGMDLKRSDTPAFMQDFLMELLTATLDNATREDLIEKIIEFKHAFKERASWEKGTPKRVNNLTKYTKLFEETGGKGVTIPGHVRAAINWNKLRKLNSDNYSPEIMDGAKTIVCSVKDNPLGYTSVAYPIDIKHLPEWFKDLPFDDLKMLNAIVNKKVDNLLGVLKWDINDATDITSTVNSFFDFG